MKSGDAFSLSGIRAFGKDLEGTKQLLVGLRAVANAQDPRDSRGPWVVFSQFGTVESQNELRSSRNLERGVAIGMANQVDESRLFQTSKGGIEWHEQSGLFADFDVAESEVLFSLQRACHRWTVRNMNRRARLTKSKRLKNGQAPRVLDLST